MPGDLVVFFDGINDIYYTVYTGSEGEDVNPVSSIPSMSAAISDRFWGLIYAISRVSAAALLLVDVRDRSVPAEVTDSAILERSLARAEADYRHELIEAHRLVTASGANFIHFLQPHLFATPLSTAYRQELARNYLETPPAVDVAFRTGYPRLRQAIAAATSAGVASIDVSGVLSAERLAEEVFLDFAHVNHVGNEVIARAMFPAIAARLGDCSAAAGDGGQLP